MKVKFGKGIIKVVGYGLIAKIVKDDDGDYNIDYFYNGSHVENANYATYYTVNLKEAIELAVLDVIAYGVGKSSKKYKKLSAKFLEDR